MANAKDVAAVIQSALGEIGVTGDVGVTMDGQEATSSLHTDTGEDVQVDVVVKPAQE